MEEQQSLTLSKIDVNQPMTQQPELQNEEGDTVWQNTHRHPNSSDSDKTVWSNYNSKIIYLSKDTELISQQT